MSLMGYTLWTAKQYYEPKAYEYVAENPIIHDDIMDNCIALAIMHE